MTVQTVKLAGERFVILKEKDYRDLKAKAAARPVRKSRRLTAQDKGDVAEAKRRMSDPTDKPIPWEQAKQELGLK